MRNNHEVTAARSSVDMSRLNTSSSLKMGVVGVFLGALIFRSVNFLQPPDTTVLSDAALLGAALVALTFLWIEELWDRERLFRVFQTVVRARDREDREQISSLMHFVSDLERKYGCMAGHAGKVAVYAQAIARQMRLSPKQIENIRTAAILHDIGNGAIPDVVLTKREPLSLIECSIIRKHPVLSENLLSHVPALRGVARMVRHHHERYDGRGYPDELQGDSIELGARILAVAEAFDAMTSPRSYRSEQLPRQHIKQELIRNAGFQFDPACVNALLSALQRHPTLWSGRAPELRTVVQS